MHVASARLPISTVSAITRFWTMRCPSGQLGAPRRHRTEKNTGDGAGILFQVPHHFFRKRLKSAARFCRQRATMAWPCCLRRTTRARMPAACLRRVAPRPACRCSFGARCRSTRTTWRRRPAPACPLSCRPSWAVRTTRPPAMPSSVACTCAAAPSKRRPTPSLPCATKIFYVCSISSRTIVYKGMLVATQMRRFFIDLNDAAVKTAVALVHSRYSTNTTPSSGARTPQPLYHPQRRDQHPQGQRQLDPRPRTNLYSPVLQHDLERVMPIINREEPIPRFWTMCLSFWS